MKSNAYHKSARETDKRIRTDTDTVSVLKPILINKLTKNGYGKRIYFWQMYKTDTTGYLSSIDSIRIRISTPF